MNDDSNHATKFTKFKEMLISIDTAALLYPFGGLVIKNYPRLAVQSRRLRQIPSFKTHLKRLTLWNLHILQHSLTHPYVLLLAVIIPGALLTAPALWRGWGVEDDVLQRNLLLSATLPEALTNLFVFLEPSRNVQLLDQGAVPWWTLDTARVSFFRPMAALTHWLDYQLWPNSAALMHAHSILWYGGMCALAFWLYRRLMGRTLIAALAALLFVMDTGRISCVTSLASRNTLLTVFFGLLTLALHDRWRRDGWRAGALLAPLCLALSLLSAEAGIATMTYLLAYAIFLDRENWRWRLGQLAPYAVVVVLWRLAYQRLGYGAWGSDFYVDPGQEPLRYVASLLERGPVLVLGQWVMPDPSVYAVLSTGAGFIFWLNALSFIALMGVLLFPLLRQDPVARFWALGMALAVIPVCAVSLPSGRHLGFVGIGAMGLMAQFIGGVFSRSDWLGARRGRRVVAWTLGLIFLTFHAFLFPVLLPSAQAVSDPYFQAITDMGPLPGVERQDVVIVNMPSPGQFIYVLALRKLRQQPAPVHTRLLAPGYSSVEVTRIDDHTVLVRPEYGYLVRPGMMAQTRWLLFPLIHPAHGYLYSEGFLRSSAFPMTVGQRVELTGMRAEITTLTDDGRPAAARLEFTVPLEDVSLRWLQWDWARNAYIPFSLPEVGQTVRVPGAF